MDKWRVQTNLDLGKIIDAKGNVICTIYGKEAVAIVKAHNEAIAAAPKAVQCPVCRGNEADMPCAYPSKNMEGCLRDKRLAEQAQDERECKEAKRLRDALQKIVDDGDYSAPEGMKRIAKAALAQKPEASTAQDEHALIGKIWKRESTGEWVLELQGSINDVGFTCRHTEPLSTRLEDVAGLPSIYAALEASTAQERGALQFIFNTFKRDIQQGYVTKDKQFVIDIAGKALATARPDQQSEASPTQDETCGCCHGSGWMVRDPDIGTDQECFACDGTGKAAQPAQKPEDKTEQQAEPVLFINREDLDRAQSTDSAASVISTTKQNGWYKTPLYLQPPAQQQLGEEAILELAKKAGFFFHDAGYAPTLHTKPLEYSQKCFERFARVLLNGGTE